MFFAYCNSAPVIAAHIVEKVSGQNWDLFTRERIFTPLGMASACWESVLAIKGRLAKSYQPDGVTEVPYVDIPGKPAGSLNLTANDLGRLIRFLLGRGTLDGMTLLKPESVTRIETPESSLAARNGLKIGYGLGNMVTLTEKGIFHGHNGNIDAFLANYLYEPQHRAGVVVMINSMSGEALATSETICRYLERSWAMPAIQPEIKTCGTELKAWQGYYTACAPAVQWLAPLERVTPDRVVIKEGRLKYNGVFRRVVGAGLFQRPDRPSPNVVFVQSAAGPLLLGPLSASCRISGWWIWAYIIYMIILLISMLLALMLLMVWLVAGVRGRIHGWRTWLVRLIPTGGLILLAAFGGCLMTALSDATYLLGTPSLPAVIIWVSSLLLPLAGLAALTVMIKWGSQLRWPLRSVIWLDILLVLVASLRFWQWGWIGLRTWLL